MTCRRLRNNHLSALKVNVSEVNVTETVFDCQLDQYYHNIDFESVLSFRAISAVRLVRGKLFYVY